MHCIPLHQTWQINWQIYPPIKHRCLAYCYTKHGRSTPQSSIDALHRVTPNLADLPPRSASAYEWQFHLSIVTAHIGRSTGRSTSQEASSAQEWQLQISVVTAYIGRSTGRCTPSNASWDIYYGMYLAAILDSSRKGGNFLLFLKKLG